MSDTKNHKFDEQLRHNAFDCNHPRCIAYAKNYDKTREPDTKTLAEQIYNILVDFALVVDDCHKRGVEPDCQEEIKKLVALLTSYEKQIREEIKSCLHDRYVSEESQGKMPDYLLARMVDICADCGQDIKHLRLLRK